MIQILLIQKQLKLLMINQERNAATPVGPPIMNATAVTPVGSPINTEVTPHEALCPLSHLLWITVHNTDEIITKHSIPSSHISTQTLVRYS